MSLNALRWDEKGVAFLDQRKLPHEEKYVHCHTLENCYNAIARMVVRGAPLIGVTAMWGLALWLKNNPQGTWDDWEKACKHLGTARPTAVNLFYAIEKCQKIVLVPIIINRNTFSGLYAEIILDLINKETGREH